mmetsp:Transcript_7694/g.10744  ORF Transcript_7694/g.10744 Transcript_7694/m.10744 type:complete len:206 (+) Transcript_7694:1096-1713(+)
MSQEFSRLSTSGSARVQSAFFHRKRSAFSSSRSRLASSRSSGLASASTLPAGPMASTTALAYTSPYLSRCTASVSESRSWNQVFRSSKSCIARALGTSPHLRFSSSMLYRYSSRPTWRKTRSTSSLSMPLVSFISSNLASPESPSPLHLPARCMAYSFIRSSPPLIFFTSFCHSTGSAPSRKTMSEKYTASPSLYFSVRRLTKFL